MIRTETQCSSWPRLRWSVVLTAALLLPVVPAFAQDNPIRARYTKTEYQIPMRDGVKLFTIVYTPNDTNQVYPIMMQRTPYSVRPYGASNYAARLGPSELFSREGFIFVYQDVRGRYMSEGAFVDVPIHKESFSGATDADESTDTYDTIDWLVKNIPNNNGRVGMWGISYPGFYTAFGLIGSHPALKAASPQAPMADVGNGDDAYHNGAFFLAANFGFYVGFAPRGPEPSSSNVVTERFQFDTQDQYDFYLRMGPLSNSERIAFKNKNEYWSDLLKHPNYDDFWAPRALAPQMTHVTPAVLVVGGWFDAEDLGGTPRLFQSIDKNGHAPADTLVMGPWSHGGWANGDDDRLGNLNFVEKTGVFFRENIEFPFFMKHLKDKGDGLAVTNDMSTPKAWVFETGSNQWERFDTWPPKNAAKRSIYLGAAGSLSFSPAPGEGQFDEYMSDPAKPVPVSSEIGQGMPGDYMTYDQRFASRRPDVLVYQTEPLDHDITIAGPVTPVLRVSTSGSDSDFVVKLIDVYPNNMPSPRGAAGVGGGRRGGGGGVPMGGYQQLVRGEPFRGKFRDSMAKPVPFVPGQPSNIEFSMPDVCHTFLKGHRIMVQIQSSWFPLTDLNPQTFVNIPDAKASDFQKATERVYRGGPDGTHLDVLVIQ